MSHRSNHHGSLFQSGRERAGAFPTQIHSASGGPPPKNAMDLVVCQTLTKKDEYRRHLPHSLSEKTTLAAGTIPFGQQAPRSSWHLSSAKTPMRLATAVAVWIINNRRRRKHVVSCNLTASTTGLTIRTTHCQGPKVYQSHQPESKVKLHICRHLPPFA